MSGITNYELEKFCKGIIGKDFLGVFPCDVYPYKFKLKNKSLIFNLSPHYEKGSHFVAILKKNKKIFYFDSFGKKCENKNIVSFLKKYTTKIYYNTKTIQSKKSIFCGLFCLAFLINCQKKKITLEKFVNMFKYPLKNNDSLCLNMILNHLKEK